MRRIRIAIVGTVFPAEKNGASRFAARLLARPDFLILDEPTNHLDTGSIEWLEDFLARYSGTCLVRDARSLFSRSHRDAVVELSRGKFYSYDGNYTDYLLARAERQAVEEMQEHKRQKFLKRELAMGAESAARAPDEIGRSGRALFRDGRPGSAGGGARRRLIIPPAPKLANRVIELRDVGMELGGRTLFQTCLAESRSRRTARHRRTQRTRKVNAAQDHVCSNWNRHERRGGDRHAHRDQLRRSKSAPAR